MDLQRTRKLKAYLLAGLVFMADQFSKFLVESNFDRFGEPTVLIESYDLVRLTFVTNRGAAWGIFHGFRFFLVSIALTVAIACVWGIETYWDRSVIWPAALVLGGGAGNLMDRLFKKVGVVDFLDVGIYSYRWPTFNVADMSLFIGAMLFVLFYGILDEPPENE